MCGTDDFPGEAQNQNSQPSTVPNIACWCCRWHPASTGSDLQPCVEQSSDLRFPAEGRYLNCRFEKDDQIFQNCDTLGWGVSKNPRRLNGLAITPPAIRCQIAMCQRHIGCSKKCNFTRPSRAGSPELLLPPGGGDTFVLIELIWSCDSLVDLKKIKAKNCSDFAEYNHSPGKQRELFDQKHVAATERQSDRKMGHR